MTATDWLEKVPEQYRKFAREYMLLMVEDAFEAGRMSFAFECGDEFEEDEKPFTNVEEYTRALIKKM